MIQQDYDQGLLTLGLNRPKQRNAINLAMYEALSLAIDKAPADCHAILIHGMGGHFTAGNDLADFQNINSMAADSPAIDFLRSLINTDIPVIAAVQGYAVGIGVTLLQHCDFVFAEPNTKFKMPFVSLGLCPEGGTTVLLESLVGRRKTSRWILQGAEFNATEALQAQLISEIVDTDSSLQVARLCAQELATQPLQALRVSKHMLRAPGRPTLLQALETERKHFMERLQSAEAQAIFTRFFAAPK